MPDSPAPHGVRVGNVEITALPAAARLFATQLSSDAAFWLMGIAGIFAFGAILVLAFLFFRALRGFPDIIEFAAITTRRLPPS